MLKLVNIVKEYKVEQESIMALNDVSIEFRRNEFVSILGPSGCGKTTLLNIVGGLDRYTSGDIQIEGISTKEYDDVDWDTYRNRRVGFVFQSYNLIPHMSILGNVALSLTLAGVGRDERKQRALEALEKVGLGSQARKKPNQLSGGQMQRVAIARALVNNPEIILADEPTGALDSESGIQVMDLLKVVAEDRLVIMVTHNPQLAEQYSTRIVSLKDGKVVGDTMPYNSDEENAEDVQSVTAEMESEEAKTPVEGESVEGVETVQTDENEIETEPKVETAPKKESFFKKLSARIRKSRKAGKSAMKLTTAISLSWNNLISKKGRTILTSIAGSIGIIGIVLVLALSNGAKMYINTLEESALSNYPITVSKSTMDVMSIFNTLLGSLQADTSDMEENKIKVQEVLGKLIPMFFDENSMGTNDLHTFKKYIDDNFTNDLANVQYEYGTAMNCYIKDKVDPSIYMKVNPYQEIMGDVLDQVMNNPLFGDIVNMDINIMGQDYNFKDLVTMMTSTDILSNVWSEMSNNTQMLHNQYELVGERSKWPTRENEIVVVVNAGNRIMDFQLFMLGLQSQTEVLDAVLDKNFATDHEYDVDEILNLRYRVMTNCDYLEQTGVNEWVMHDRTENSVEYVEDDAHCVKFSDGSHELKVVGVVKPKIGAVASSISGIIGYQSSLTEYLLDHASKHHAIEEMLRRYEQAYEESTGEYESPISFYANANDKDYAKKIGDPIGAIGEQTDEHYTILRQLGFVDKEYPQAIRFFCSSFDAKDDVIAFIDDYNATHKKEQEIQYTDSLEQMMGFIDTMVTTITGVLVAFAAISLIVSTIMIAIIIYTSVLERRKEIGVLRSIGARKKDISRVFIAESAILGGYSGLIGVFFSYIFSLVVSRILLAVFQIAGLMTVTWYHCVIMFAVSVLLSMFAGFIPSRIAANKDPAIALRSE